MAFIKKLLDDEGAQNTIEYVIIIAVLAIGLIAILGAFRGQISKKFADMAQAITSAN
ncbi:MAG: hypothetical protein ACYC1U_06645 [Candidatus Aquicultorales bacterium]